MVGALAMTRALDGRATRADGPAHIPGERARRLAAHRLAWKTAESVGVILACARAGSHAGSDARPTLHRARARSSPRYGIPPLPAAAPTPRSDRNSRQARLAFPTTRRDALLRRRRETPAAHIHLDATRD